MCFTLSSKLKQPSDTSFAKINCKQILKRNHAGPPVDCPLVECGAPPALAGVVYDGNTNNRKVCRLIGAQFFIYALRFLCKKVCGVLMEFTNNIYPRWELN